MGERLDRERWLALMKTIDAPDMAEVFERLQTAHAQPHRAYHTAAHINACLRHLDAHVDLADRPERIELALWFHDAIYKPMSKTNEADSADLARALIGGVMARKDMDWIDRAIRLTRDHGDTEDPDTALLLDIDLSILAASPDVYDSYTQNVRREYRWVPGPIYRKGRREVLRHFLNMERIYKTDALAANWERPARRNLSAELERLTP